jgi:hypothetical protein
MGVGWRKVGDVFEPPPFLFHFDAVSNENEAEDGSAFKEDWVVLTAQNQDCTWSPVPSNLSIQDPSNVVGMVVRPIEVKNFPKEAGQDSGLNQQTPLKSLYGKISSQSHCLKAIACAWVMNPILR